MLSQWNSLTPTFLDDYADFSDGLGANNNPLAGFSNSSYDRSMNPRGAFPLTFFQIDRQ